MEWKILKATFKRNLIINLRAYPKDFFIGNLLTGVYTVISALFMYKMLFDGNITEEFVQYTSTGDYMGYIILGSLTYLFAVRTCLNVSRSLIIELREGTLESLMMAPFKRIEYFMGNMLHQTLATSFEIMVSVIIAIPFGLTFKNMNFISFLLVFIISLFGFFSLSLVLGALMLYTRDTYISQNTLFVGILLLCGITFPIDYLPYPLRILGKLIPVTEISNLIRGATLLGYGILEQMPRIIYVVLLSLVYLVIGFKSFKYVEKIALEKIQG